MSLPTVFTSDHRSFIGIHNVCLIEALLSAFGIKKLKMNCINRRTFSVHRSDLKTAILSKVIYWFNTIPIKIPLGFFEETDELILKFTQKYKGLRLIKTILKRKNKS